MKRLCQYRKVNIHKYECYGYWFWHCSFNFSIQFWNCYDSVVFWVFHYINCPDGVEGEELWLWSYGSWIYNYLCSQCLSPLMLWVRISIKARCTILCDKVCQWLAIGRWFSPGPLFSSTNKTDCHDITEMLLKMALNIIKETNCQEMPTTKIYISKRLFYLFVLFVYYTDHSMYYWIMKRK